MKSVLLKCQPSRASHTRLQCCAFTLLNNRSILESFHFTEFNDLRVFKQYVQINVLADNCQWLVRFLKYVSLGSLKEQRKRQKK